MSFLELAEKRYSVKDYSDRPVEQEKLDRVLEAGRLAPTAKNNQPQKIYVVKSEEGLKKLGELTRCTYHAPVVFIMGYMKDEEWTNPQDSQYHSGVEDISIVATHMMLEAADLGLGTCWVNAFPNTKTAEAFDLPSNFVPILLLDLGYASDKGKPLPNHTNSKDINDMVEYR